MKKIYGMTIRDWKILGNMLRVEKSTHRLPTIEEVIERGAKHECFTSKRGIEHIKMFYTDDTTKIFEKSNISRTPCYDEEKLIFN